MPIVLLLVASIQVHHALHFLLPHASGEPHWCQRVLVNGAREQGWRLIEEHVAIKV